MKAILAYFKEVIEDPISLRICVACWGIPFGALGLLALVQWQPTELWEWLGIALTTAIGVYGLFLIYAACFGSDPFFERATNYASDGADVFGLFPGIAVAIVAIPSTILLRVFRRSRRG